MPIKPDDILAALGTVQDPDLGKDLVSLGMIEDIQVGGNTVSFTLVLTTPACPLAASLRQQCVDAVRQRLGSGLQVDVKVTSRVTTLRGGKQDILPGVQNIIAVASGKGGVGKSTVAVNLAFALARSGARTGLLDADIYGPSIPVMLGMRGMRPVVHSHNGKPQIEPLVKDGVKVISIGFLVEEKQAVVWRGPMASSALKQFVSDCDWGELDYLVVDLPPGTGDIHLTLLQTVPVTGAIIVTTPQEVALADARKAVGMFRMPALTVPVLGVVENMSYFIAPDGTKNYIFGQAGGERLAGEFDVPLLGQIPLVQDIREGGDAGVPAVLKLTAPSGTFFLELAAAVARRVAVVNAQAVKKEDHVETK